MKRNIIKASQAITVMAALAILVSIGAGTALAENYEVDRSHSRVGFKVKHLAISNVSGLFKEFTGTIVFNKDDISATTAQAKIVVKSIDTDEKKRDDHLVSADFFDAEKYPEITFASTKIEKIKGDQFTIVGDLTIHGTTKTVELDTKFSGAVTDPWGKERIAFEATSKINRKEFGMTWNKLLETGGLVVGEEVTIVLEIEAIKKK